MEEIVTAYTREIDPERRELFMKLQALIYETVPDIEVKKAYGVLKYYHGKNSIFLGFWKQGVSIYPGYLDELSDFRTRHPEIKTRVGTINLKLGDAIPWQEIRDIITKRLIG